MEQTNKRNLRRILYGTLAMLLCLSTVGQEFEEIFYEGFENGGKIPTGWTQQFVLGSRSWRFENGGYAPAGAPTFRHPSAAYAGSYNALFQDESVGPIRRLITKEINLVPYGSATIKPTLCFWHAQDSWGGATDELRVYYRRSSSSDWVLLEHYTSAAPNWTLREMLLPDDAKTETCQIAFEGISNWGWGVCIDEVKIEERGIVDRKVESFELKQKSSIIPSGSNVNPFGYLLALVSGNHQQIPLNSITLNYTGTDIGDIENINIYHTRDSTFSVNSKIPAEVSILGNEITVTAPTFNLRTGNNYIWFVFDINSESAHGNTVDFNLAANSVLLGDKTFPATAQHPAGAATIYESLMYTNFSDGNTWAKTSLWEVGEPEGVGIYDPSDAFSGANVLATNLAGNYPPGITNVSPETAISQSVDAKFYQNLAVRYRRWLNIEYFDKTSVKISNDAGIIWENIFQNNTAILDRSWQPISTDISQWATRKEDIRIMFSMDTTNLYTEYGGWNIDNFAITGEFIHSDVGITDATAPVQTCGLMDEPQEVRIMLRNFGGATVDVPFDIGYSLNAGSTYVRETYNTALESEADQGGVYEVEYTFATTADFTSPGLKNLKFRTFLEGDQDASNDGYEKTIYVFSTEIIPYQTSFEGNDAYWYPNGINSSWQWGAPSGTNINTASDGNRVWATALSQNYNHNEKSYLESPCFDLSTAEMPVIAFDYIMQVEQGADGLTLEYSIDGGASWTLLPAHEHYVNNWFDTPEVTALGSAGWSVNKAEYVTVKNLLPSDVVGVNGVKFRFVFGSDGATRAEGVALDMIRVYELPYDVGITELISPTSACEIGKDVALELKLKNFGYRTVPHDAPIAIVVKVDGGDEKSEIITIPADIIQDGDYTFTSTNTFNLFSAGVHSIVAYTNLAIDDDYSNDTLKTTVEVLGMPEFTLGPDVGVEDFNTPYTIDAGAGYSSYSWYELPDETTSVGSNQTLDVDAEGVFKVFVTKYINEELTCEAEDDISVMFSTKDVGVISIENLADACEHDAPISPEIVIQSFRNSPFDGTETIPLVVEVDGEIALTEDYTPDNGWGTLDETIPYTFTGTIDLSEAKTYSISIYTNLSDDLDRDNDGVSVSVDTYGLPEVIILTRTEQAPDVFEPVTEIISTRADTLVLKANDGFNSYQWERKTPDETIWTSLTSAQAYTPSSKNTNEYRVTVVDPNGCGTPETNNQVVLVNAYDLSLISINNLTEEICYTGELVPLSITLKNSGQDDYPIGTEIAVAANTPMGNQDEIITLDTPLGIGGELVHEFSESVNLPIGESYLSFSATTANDPVTSNNDLSITTTVHPASTVTIEPSILYKVFDQYEAYEIIPTYSEPYSEADVYTYIWHDGTVDPTYLVYNPTDYPIYEVTVENSFGCTASSSMSIISADLQVSSIVSPFTDCGLTNETPVIVSIKNSGNTTYTAGTNIDVDLYLDGTLVTAETITLTQNLASKGSREFTLSQTLDLSAATNATIQVDISSAAEEVYYDNNSRNKTVYALGYPTPNLGEDRDVHAWEEVLDPGYYDAYLWNDGSTERELVVTEDGTYSVTVTDFSGCQASDEVTITFYIDDIELVEVLSPISGCNLTNAEEVKVVVKNRSSFTLPAGQQVEVGYIHNSIPYSEIYTLSSDLDIDETLEVTLSQPLNLLERKAHEVTFFVDMDNDMRAENNQIEAIVNSYANPTVSIDAADGTTVNKPLLLDAGVGYASYQWQFESVDIDEGNNQTYTATQTGNYSVVVTNEYGCVGTDNVFITVLKPDYGITQLINPVNDCELGDNQIVTVEITNFGDDILGVGDEIDVTLWLNGIEEATEVFTPAQNLNPDESVNFTFSKMVNLLSDNEHAIAAELYYPLDVNSDNNYMEVQVVAYGFPTIDLGGDQSSNTGVLELDAGPGFVSYLWQDGSTNQKFTVTQTGDYSVTVIDEHGCEGGDYVHVTILEPDYGITQLISPVSACELGDDETVTAVLSNFGDEILGVGDEMSIILWLNGIEQATEVVTLNQELNLNESVEFTLTKTVDLSSDTEHTISLETAYPFDVNSSNNRLDVQLVAYGLPTVTLPAIDPLCFNAEPLTLAGGLPEGGIYSGNGVTDGIFSPADAGAGFHTITYSYTDENGCTFAASQDITVYEAPQVDLGGDQTVSEPFTIDAGPGFVSYLWQDGSTEQTFLVEYPGTYSVVVEDENGCVGSDEVTIDFDCSLLLIVELISPDTHLCEADVYVVEVEVVNKRREAIESGETIIVTYQVSGYDSVEESFTLTEELPNNATFTFTFSEPLNLSVGEEVMMLSADYDELPGTVFEQALTVNPSPFVNLGDDLEVTFPYTILSGLTDLDFLWSTGETTPTIVVDEPGEYWLTVTNEYGCQASDTVVLVLSSVYKIPGSGTVVTVYPNPADQWITINVEPRQPALFTIELISQAGQLVYSENIKQNQPFTHRVDVSKFVQGVYLLRVSSDGEWVTVKVIIQ
ncbi:MAG: T9SS type A sorting domain-containing protein [Tenuifilaceae bacterium]|nr:T9SS type A sorting domain-containing protein [Tenuifilaceae bacterium]